MSRKEHILAAIGFVLAGIIFWLVMAAAKAAKASEAKAAPEPEEDHGIRLERERDFPGFVHDGIRVRVISIDGQRFVVVYGRHGVAVERMVEPWDVQP